MTERGGNREIKFRAWEWNKDTWINWLINLHACLRIIERWGDEETKSIYRYPEMFRGVND